MMLYACRFNVGLVFSAKRAFACLILSCCCMAHVGFSSPAAEGEPLQFSKRHFSVSNLPAGEPYIDAYPFRNVSDVTVHIVQIETSCGCTTATTDAASYAPGARGKLSIELRGDKVGDQDATIHLFDMEGEILGKVDITAEFVKVIAVDPAAVELGEIQETPAKTFTLDVRSQLSNKIIEISVLEKLDGVTMSIPNVSGGVRAVRLNGSVDPSRAPTRGILNLVTKLEGGRVLTTKVPLNFNLHRELEMFPNRQYIGKVSSQDKVETKVLLRGDKDVLNDLKASCNVPASIVTLSDVPIGKQVKTEFTAADAAGVTSPSLTIVSKSRSYEVPFVISVQP